jgi:thioredoxin-like negative regulator of GroEL
MKPVVDGLKKEYQGKVDIVRIDANTASGKEAQLANQFGVTAVPTFVFLNSDGTVANKIIGGAEAAAMRTQLDALK